MVEIIHHKPFTMKEIQAMKNSTMVLANLLSHFPRSEFEKAVKKYSGDRRVRTLSTCDLLKGLIYGQTTGAFSVREIESSLAAHSSKLYHCGMKPIKRSTFCDAMETRNHQIFEAGFQALVSKAQMISGNNGRKFKNPLKIIDASTIELCLTRFDWAKFRTAKGAVKLHVALNGDSLFPEQVRLTTGSIHEVNELSNFDFIPGDIAVMDRGYVDYKRLSDIDLAGSFFVTRMKNNCQHQHLKIFSSHQGNSIRCDELVKLTSPKGRENYSKELRKVTYYDAEYERDYVFITNNFDLSAQQIADIYKARWQVELFFKWIKQNLKIKTFWGTSLNAVFIQIWVALIVFILLWITKNIDGITASAQRILQLLKTSLFSNRTIAELLSEPVPPERDDQIQLYLQGFKY